MEKVPYLGRELLRWQVGNSTFLAMPELGARLMHWHITLGDGTQRDVIYWPEVKTLEDFHRIRGGNPILFPFNARCYDEGELGFWKDPTGTRRPMTMHGYARQGKFKITRLDGRGFAAQFVPGEEAKAAYPYEYEFTVTYRFEPLGLACELSLKNLDKVPLPWSAGHHFYFAAPWTDGAKRSDYRIRIPATKTYKQNAQGLLETRPALQPVENLANPALVDTIHTGLQSAATSFGPADGPGEVTVKLGTQKVPPAEAALVTWTQDEQASFYCVEPWMGPPNAPGTKVGLHWVQPGQTQTFVVEVLAK